MRDEQKTVPHFSAYGLADPLLRALSGLGYETPTPIQAAAIPLILAGHDVLGQAQTGTGKTAAFALPLLSRIDLKRNNPQVLVLTPTRELAIQVAEAFQRYAARLKGFHVMPVYGGQDYNVQLRQLRRGVHVVVGTPGRVMDHMRRQTLDLQDLRTLVLDEGDEMLRMGFIDDVKWVLEQIPEACQLTLFSATMPAPIRRIANKYLKNPEHIQIAVRTVTAETITQRYCIVHGNQKLDALTRILEVEDYEGVLVFVRTKTATVELAEKLSARGHACAPLSGDITQRLRERTVDALRSGKLDLIIATDVAARGLDVQRISHVINYDIPHDTEAYIHRVGRTGRAGRSGEAILFVAPRETRMLATIERATRRKIEPMRLPSSEAVRRQRIVRFKQRVLEALDGPNDEMTFFEDLIAQISGETEQPPNRIAAALAKIVQSADPLRAPVEDLSAPKARLDRGRGKPRDERPRKKGHHELRSNEGLVTFRLAVGTEHGVTPGNIVGAIANEAGLNASAIGRIDIHDTYSTVDLPAGMPPDIRRHLAKVWVAGQQLKIRQENAAPTPRHSKAATQRKSTVPPKKTSANKGPANKKHPARAGKKRRPA